MPFKLKQNWIVSVAALVYRLHALELLSAWQYRSLFVELSRLGYRTSEPDSAPRETSAVLNQVFTALREDSTTKADVARDLAVHPEELDALVFNLAVVGVRGGNRGAPAPGGKRPALALIKGGSCVPPPARHRSASDADDEYYGG